MKKCKKVKAMQSQAENANKQVDEFELENNRQTSSRVDGGQLVHEKKVHKLQSVYSHAITKI